MMQWPPNYKKITLEEGDEHAIHSGGKGGLQMNELTTRPNNSEQELAIPEEDETTSPVEVEALTEDDQLRLRSWEKLLDKLDLESRWSKKD